ncbi:MAG: hypothetical protein ACR2NZ_10705 [Rubripirellula sp.]
MELHLSVASGNRSFADALRRVFPIVQPRLNRIAKTKVTKPPFKTVLIGITNECASSYVESISDSGPMLQLLTGFSDVDNWSPENDAQIIEATVSQIEVALGQCGLTAADHDLLVSALQSGS